MLILDNNNSVLTYLFEEPVGELFNELGVSAFGSELHRILEKIVLFAKLDRLLPSEFKIEMNLLYKNLPVVLLVEIRGNASELEELVFFKSECKPDGVKGIV